MIYHTSSVKQVLNEFDTALTGLSAAQASDQLAKFGSNEIKSLKKRTPFEMLLAQFKDFMIMVLIVAAIISGIVGEPIDTIAIIVIVIVNAVIGFVQEYRAEKAIEALKKMASPNAAIMRNGQHHIIPAAGAA